VRGICLNKTIRFIGLVVFTYGVHALVREHVDGGYKGGWRDAWLSPKHILKSHPLDEELLLVVSVRIGKTAARQREQAHRIPKSRSQR